MGLIRATYRAGKAAVKGASGAEIAKEGVKGMLPRSMGGIVDKVATPQNVSRVSQGMRNVVDSGRGGTFSTSMLPPPPPGSSSSSQQLPPPPPGSR